MTKLSVNINKIATLRNSRGGNEPNVVDFALDIQSFGAEGITVHPRPDERHIKYDDVYALKNEVYTEFNIEGNPIEKFMKLIIDVKPTQATLVPDKVDAITSNSGWNTIEYKNMLKDIINELKSHGIRTSIFLDPDTKYINSLVEINPDRVELYTEEFAREFLRGNFSIIDKYKVCADIMSKEGIGINAGHDLSLKNIKYFANNIENLAEVSIGHALITESLHDGLKKTIKKYLQLLSK